MLDFKFLRFLKQHMVC